MSETNPFLSVVIPSYNEKENLKRGVLKDVVSFLKKQNYSWEIILTDDGSDDGTIEELEKFASKYNNVKVVTNIHAGKGPTVKAGMLTAKGKWRLFTDFDQSTPIQEVAKLLAHKETFPIVIGSREGEKAKRDKEPFYRHLMGRGFNFLVRFLAVPGIQDTQCGFKMFSDEATETLFEKMVVYGNQKERGDAFTGAFDVELLFLAKKNGFKIKEIPILWKHHDTDRVNPVKDSIRMLIDIVKIRMTDISGKYNRGK